MSARVDYSDLTVIMSWVGPPSIWEVRHLRPLELFFWPLFLSGMVTAVTYPLPRRVPARMPRLPLDSSTDSNPEPYLYQVTRPEGAGDPPPPPHTNLQTQTPVDVWGVLADDRHACSPLPPAGSQPERGQRPDKGRFPLIGGGYLPHRRCHGGGYWGLPGVPPVNSLIPTGVLLSTEADTNMRQRRNHTLPVLIWKSCRGITRPYTSGKIHLPWTTHTNLFRPFWN